MAIPEDRLSTLLVASHFLPPDDQENGLLLDYELGPVALNDTSEGLMYQTWTMRYIPATGEFVVHSPNTDATVVHTASGVTELSFTFDQNGRVFIAYVQSGTAKYFWWDTALGSTTVTNLPAGTLTPRCGNDDKRLRQSGEADIILCYVYGGALYERKERERYGVSYKLQDPFLHPVYELPAVIKRVGMNLERRFQILCDLANPIDWCNYVNSGG